MDATIQRAPHAPPLPPTPLRFVLYFVGRYRWWYLAMVLLEGINSTCGILMPYATGRIIKAVTQAQGQATQAVVDSLAGSLWLFIALGIGEVIFSRAGGTCQIYVGALQRHTVTRALYGPGVRSGLHRRGRLARGAAGSRRRVSATLEPAGGRVPARRRSG